MQFSIIGTWLIEGRSPYTKLPVTETCRIVKPGQGAWYYFDGRIRSIYTPSHLISYQVGKTYAIQPGRGQKAIGLTPPIESIRRQDVREMTREDAIARGFHCANDYIVVWARMHDPELGLYQDTDMIFRYYPDRRGKKQSCYHPQLHDVLMARPAERYDAWVLRFAASGDNEQGRG